MSKGLKYWCWICHCVRTHRMLTEKKGICDVCKTINYAPMGDID